MRSSCSTTRMLAISALLVCLFLSTSCCGTLSTYRQYQDYKECLADCNKLQADSYRGRCESDCYKRFDWSESPLLKTFQNLEEKPLQPEFEKARNKKR